MKSFFCYLLILYFGFSAFNAVCQNTSQKSEFDAFTSLDKFQIIKKKLNSANDFIRLNKNEEALNLCIEAINMESRILLDVVHKIELNDKIASTLSFLGAFEYGINYTKSSIELLTQQDSVDPYEVTWRIGRIGSYCLFSQQLDSALFYFRKALPWARLYGKPIYLSAAFNNLGIVHAKINTDSAYHYFHLAKETMLLETDQDSTLLASINDNNADLLCTEKKYKEASALYLWNYNCFLSSNKSPYRAQEPGLQLAQTYLDANTIKPLFSLLSELEANVDTNYLRHHKTLLHLWAVYFERLGNTKKQLHFLQEQLKVSESLRNQTEAKHQLITDKFGNFNIRRIERQLEIVKLKSATQENLLDLAQQKAINRLIIIWTSLALALLSVIALYLNYRKKIEVKKREQEKLDNELALKKRDLEDFALEINQKQEWTDQLTEKLSAMRSLEKEDIASAIRSLLVDVKGTQIAEKQKRVFQQNIQEVNHQFFDKLSTLFGDLTKTERELAGLLRMELSNKEIATLRNMEVSSVKRARNRLRKKLDLSPEQDIYTFLKEI